MAVTKAQLAKRAKKIGTALMNKVPTASASKLLVKLPVDAERFKILVATVTQVICPMFAPLTMGIAHAMYSNDPNFDLNGAFIGIGIFGALVFLVLLGTFIMLCYRCVKGGHSMFMLMRPVLALFILNIFLFLIGVIYAGINLLCKTVTYSKTAVCVSQNAMSLAVLELFTACLILLKETLYSGLRMAEIKARVSGGAMEYEGSDDEYYYNSYQNVAEGLQRSMRDYQDDEDFSDPDTESVIGQASKIPRKYTGKMW
ncbi:membrane protein ORF81 [Cyprinid herpesvirus 3]|uniref:Major envelope protein n=1 Tax=Cyprinid herpesvirus 3 TaxID=180230 RepID=Q75N29_CYHV3|nr:unnamed protein product [Cyprinid herpesvirus 3]ABF81815.1 hypothetical protein [Cyprinid herpesvirus 3]ABG42908.1 membrane protein ORF81 [Cyprinid herpesvirus 3]ACN58565.1 major envelope protein [Cyprinid herpesvirus 3]AFG30052.1 putative envelope glycoprotein [Cyprinid herpesvirus 3]AIC32436.1 ORF81R [Cyprinid herpesvirus 3]